MYYIAYGSNLSLEQMAYRCPGARVAGTAVLTGWQLEFGAHATIEPLPGAAVPVVIWEITESDEKALDRYEGFPRYYYKQDLDVILIGEDGERTEVTAMVYIMTELRRRGVPSESYVEIIAEGYRRFGFDPGILQDALERCGY